MYNYLEPGYTYLSTHRKCSHYDPRNTTNEIILDTFKEIEIRESGSRNSRASKLLTLSYLDVTCKYNSGTIQELPIGFNVYMHDINMAWVNIIKEMVFKNSYIDTFYAEYSEVINNIIQEYGMDNKNSLVYRYYASGETLFHLAAKAYLFEVRLENSNSSEIGDIIHSTLSNILLKYNQLSRCIGSGTSILELRDFSNKALKQFLIDLCVELLDKEGN